MRCGLFLAALGCGLLTLPAAVRAEELPPKYQEAIDRGLEWLARQQHRAGYWEGNGGQYPIALTGLAGMALLMEGSTIRDGKYSANIARAVDWLMARSQPNGLLGDPRNDREVGRYMYGHGYAMLFLSCVYGEEEDGERRRRLEDILTRAVLFSGQAQSSTGGWNYVSARDSGDHHEGSVTITQVQALRAARNAGIVVPKEIIDKAHDYLKKSMTPDGGVMYRLGQGNARPALAAQAITCLFSAGEYHSEHAKKMLRYCQINLPLTGGAAGRFGHFEYTHYYYSQVHYALGDDGFAKLFPESKESERLTWSKYKAVMFDQLVSMQQPDGSWQMSYIGPVYTTACFLAILQLEKGALPIYQR
ncbi:MAG TPA: prenyltransferase/squalene oxidase repeat-containing protein [Gemmataceae bacterium]|nr:prenyltransferase/squalene oxidase repeat-containing protein [Gemmataceae bacterium]